MHVSSHGQANCVHRSPFAWLDAYWLPLRSRVGYGDGSAAATDFVLSIIVMIRPDPRLARGGRCFARAVERQSCRVEIRLKDSIISIGRLWGAINR